MSVFTVVRALYVSVFTWLCSVGRLYCTTYLHVRAQLHILTCTYIASHTYMYVRLFTYLHVHTILHVLTCMYASSRTYMYMQFFTYSHVCTPLHVLTCTYSSSHTHMYIRLFTYLHELYIHCCVGKYLWNIHCSVNFHKVSIISKGCFYIWSNPHSSMSWLIDSFIHTQYTYCHSLCVCYLYTSLILVHNVNESSYVHYFLIHL